MFFVVKDAPAELKARYPALQISISQTIALTFGFRNRTQVMVATADEASHSASHVELTFKDEYLSRSDMWRLVVSELSQKTIYRDQRLLFLGTIKATVKNVWIDGQRRRSGYFSSSTKPIFRSESARFVLFIQMSQEMWNFDSEGSGEIMFNKVINGFLPELFKNWVSINARHLVSIVLFSRIEYDEDDEHDPLRKKSANGSLDQRDRLRTTPLESAEAAGPDSSSNSAPRDFYRVVVSEMASNDWVKILWQLKKEFRTFLRDISIQRVNSAHHGDQYGRSKGSKASPEYVIVGKPTIASRGNVLEAINLASLQFSRDYVDRDLIRTGISIVVITAGAGVYEVDHSMLNLTNEMLISTGISIDLVCLSPMPLHSVPLFMYRKLQSSSKNTMTSDRISLSPGESDAGPDQSVGVARLASLARPTNRSMPTADGDSGEWDCAMPHWIDVSFWRGTADEQAVLMRQKKPKRAATTGGKRLEFALRCRMYELQMMGVMENDMINIAIPYLHESSMHPWHKIQPQMTGRALTDNDRSKISNLERDWMEDYDDTIFKPLEQRRAAEDNASEKTRGIIAEAVPGAADVKLRPTSDQMGTSYRPGTGYLDWRMADRPMLGTSADHRSTYAAPLSSTEKILMPLKSIRSSRHISIGSSGLTTARPVVSTDLSMTAANAKPSRYPTDPTVSPAQGLSKYTQRFRSVLTRSPSQTYSPSQGDTDETEQPTKPIDIGATRHLVDHSRSSSRDILASSEASEQDERDVKPSDLLPSPAKSRAAGAIFNAVSNARNVPSRLEMTASGDNNVSNQTGSPKRSLSPWLVMVNPCNPEKNDLNINSQFRRWQHVFPQQLRTASMKWKSLCSPASVPLTHGYFPTAEQLMSEFEESQYRLSQNTEGDLSEAPQSREALIREMIAFRLSHGFQLVVGAAVSEFLGSHTTDLVDIFDKDYMAKEGATVFMSAGNAIHQLLCTASGDVEVRRFRRKSPAAAISQAGKAATIYKSYVRTFLEGNYELRDTVLNAPRPDFNWNYVDTFLAGYHEGFSDSLRFWRARFVLIPVDIPSQGRRALAILSEDSAEESRLEGIRKLTQMWQRHQVLPLDERVYQSTRRRKDPNPLAIEYQTRDPSAVVASGPDSAMLSEVDSGFATTTIFSDVDTYSTKNVDLKKLAYDLQSEKGIKIIDRRWHFRLHYHCFLGFDLTNWLLEHFRDIDSREDAVTFGNELMSQGAFPTHADKAPLP